MKKLFLISIFVTICIGVTAQNKWTLRECIDYAVENNLDLKQTSLDVENAEINLNTSRHSRLPDLRASVGQGFSFGQSTVRVENPSEPGTYIDMLQDTKAASTNFSVSTGISLFEGRRIHNQIKSDRLDLKASVENLNKARENLELQVASLYLDVLFQKEILLVYLSEAQLTASQVERTSVLVDNGKVPMSQLYEIKSKLAQDELNVTNADNQLLLSLLNLAQALNLEDHYSFDVLEPSTDREILVNAGVNYSPADIYERALSIKPHVKEAEYRLEGSEYDLKIAKAAYYPSLTMSAGYNNGFMHVFGQSNESIKTQLKKRGNESIGLNLSIPIFNRMGTRNRVRSATLSVTSRELQLDNVKLSIYKEIQQAHQSATSAQAKFKSTQKALEAAEESFVYTQERYSAGKATAYELGESQTSLTSARSQQLQSKYDYIFRNKILDFYRGIEIDIEY